MGSESAKRKVMNWARPGKSICGKYPQCMVPGFHITRIARIFLARSNPAAAGRDVPVTGCGPEVRAPIDVE